MRWSIGFRTPGHPLSAHSERVGAGAQMRVQDRMQVLARRPESDRAWLLHSYTGHRAVVAASLQMRERRIGAEFAPAAAGP
jgi:hypothetical protein